MNKALEPAFARAPDNPLPDDPPRGAGARVGIGQPHESAALHVTGGATYTDDIPELADTLHCALGLAPVAAGRLLGADLDPVRAQPGVVAVFTAQDIPGSNNWGSIVHDDPILCDGEIRYLGQPVFAVVAETREQARRAAALAKQVLRVEAVTPVLTAREAHALGQYVVPPMHMLRSESGLDEAGMRARIASAPQRLQGQLDVGGQEQFYLEARSATPFPRRPGACMCIARPSTRARCSTWWPTPWALPRTPCGWNAGAWAAALAARKRSLPCLPAWPAWRRGCWPARSSCAWTATTIS